MSFAGKFFVSDNQEIYKCDKAANWYVFRHGRWDIQCVYWKSGSMPGWIVSEHRSLGGARRRALRDWVKSFYELKLPDASFEGFNSNNMYYESGAENSPFWSEKFLYALLGKEDARTVLARLRRLEDISEAYL